MIRQIALLDSHTCMQGTTSVNTIIHCHNEVSQVCLAALKDGTYIAMWDYNDMAFESHISAEHFVYLCASANKHTNIWFDFELHDCSNDTLAVYLQAFPFVKHV